MQKLSPLRSHLVQQVSDLGVLKQFVDSLQEKEQRRPERWHWRHEGGALRRGMALGDFRSRSNLPKGDLKSSFELCLLRAEGEDGELVFVEPASKDRSFDDW